jgi:putative addiction module killer protein
MVSFNVINYTAADGVDIFDTWLRSVRDVGVRANILRRIDRLSSGNAGAQRYLRRGISELKIDVGPGYRVYFARVGELIILLLCGGNKSTQGADIERAISYLEDWRNMNRGQP